MLGGRGPGDIRPEDTTISLEGGRLAMAWDRNNVGLRDSRDCFWGVLRQQGRYSGRGTTVTTVNLLRFLGLVSEKGLFIIPYTF